MNVKMECLEGITPVNVEVLLEIQFLQIHVLLFQDKSKGYKYCQNQCITCGCRKLKCIPILMTFDILPFLIFLQAHSKY